MTAGGESERLAVFERAGVPTAARLADGRLCVAHQHFPEDNEIDFDKVAVHFSSDEGRTWTKAIVIRLKNFPAGMRFPFDPTLVPLPDGNVRLYFTSHRGGFDGGRPAIYSAVSRDAIEFTFEPGVRFGIEGRPVIDCAVALHRGVFHLFSPDNGAGMQPRDPRNDDRDASERPKPGTGYHATSKDGLDFTRQSDVQLGNRRVWLGNVQSDGDVLRFFGTGGPGGGWVATSANAETWMLEENFGPLPGADPGAVKLKDGSWLVAGTTPPRPGTPSAQRRGPPPGPPR